MTNEKIDYHAIRERVVRKVSQAMSAKRFQHSLGVEKATRTLAKLNGADIEQAGLAGLVHDYAKERSDEEFVAMIHEKHLDSDLLNWNNNVWHGVVGRFFVEAELGITDPAILQAIERHTTGDAKMSLLDKLLYVGDYIEENRVFPGVDEARALAQVDLDLAVSFETEQTLCYLISQHKSIYPKTLATYNAYVAHFKEDL